MRIPFDLEGFEGHELVVEAASFFSGPKLKLDGKLVPKGPKRNLYLLQRNDGIKQIVQLKQVLIDPVPRLIVGGEVIHLVQPLSVFQWVWSAFPIILIFLGGALGGGIGGAAFWINARIFRSEMSTIEQFILTGLTTAITIFLYLILSTLFLRMFY
jgi:hypothetical protein